LKETKKNGYKKFLQPDARLFIEKGYTAVKISDVADHTNEKYLYHIIYKRS
jgi:hypothetical protein